jgi:hypothetical protein
MVVQGMTPYPHDEAAGPVPPDALQNPKIASSAIKVIFLTSGFR